MPRKNIIFLFLFGLFVILSLVFIDPNANSDELLSQIHRGKVRSTDLQKIVINEDNRVITRFENADGELTYAAELHYAMKVTTKTATGTVELYYDEEGKPAKNTSGYYGLLMEYNSEGQEVKRTFLGLDQNPVICYEGYAIIDTVYDDTENNKTVYFFDDKGEPVCTSFFGHGKKSEFDENGKIQKITYLNTLDEPMVTDIGYASVVYSYYSDESHQTGKVEYEYYFDALGEPIALALGEYGVHKEYDSDGNNSVITYLGQDGNPIVTNEGYTSIKRTFFLIFYIETESYYDINGTPYNIGERQYGTQKIVSGKGRPLDENGNVSINIRNILDRYPFLIITFALVLLFLSTAINKRMNWALMVIYLICIVYLTLLYRRAKETYTFYGLFRSYSQLLSNAEIRAGILKNIWLFIPLGTILYNLCPNKTVLLIPIIISILIESIQLFVSIGYCELDDVISNSLGGLIGFEMEKIIFGMKDILCKESHK